MTKPAFIARQGRHPNGLLGHLVARVMAAETRDENDRLLDLMNIAPRDEILEIGFGHGETLHRAARQARRGRLAGIDPSELMLSRARRRNRDLIWENRLDLRLGRAQSLPFEDRSFDKVMSVHTLYFWEDLAGPMAEACRVLRPGGCIALAYRSTADLAAVRRFPAEIYRFRSVARIEAALDKAGFDDMETTTARVGARLVHWTLAHKGWDPFRTDGAAAEPTEQHTAGRGNGGVGET